MNIDWSNISTVLLDMDGTLLDLHFDNFFWLEHMPAVFAEQQNLSLEQAQKILVPMFEQQQGHINWYCVDFWSEQLQLDIMHYKEQVSHKIKYRAGAQEFLLHCSQQMQDVRLVTNAHRKVLQIKIELTALDKYFHQLVSSHDYKTAKEQSVFWQNLHQQSHFDPATTLFIDDSESVLDAAHDFGIGHIYSIATPDSQTKRASMSKYPMLDDLSDVIKSE